MNTLVGEQVVALENKCYLDNMTEKQIEIDYRKVRRVIKSCQCEEHLAVANRVITCFYMKHGNDFLLKNLEKRFRIKKKLLSKA